MAVEAARTVSIAEAIDEAFESHLARVHTCLPGVIDTYDKDTQTADVQIVVRQLIKYEDGTSELEKFTIIPRVPVEFSQSNAFFMSFPLAKGDFVWLHFSEQSLDTWLTNGGTDVQDPRDQRFALKDAFAVPARNPKKNIAETEGDAIVIGGKGSAPRAYFTDSIIALGSKSPSSFVALASSTDNGFSSVKTQWDTHIHPTPFGPTSPPAVPFTAPSSVAATKVKAV